MINRRTRDDGVFMYITWVVWIGIMVLVTIQGMDAGWHTRIGGRGGLGLFTPIQVYWVFGPTIIIPIIVTIARYKKPKNHKIDK